MSSDDPTTPTLVDGDSAWLLTSTALVYMMTPALAFFYGGMVDTKNIINQLFLSIICMGIVTVQWHLVGYSFAFSPNNDFWGNFQFGALDFGLTKDNDFLTQGRFSLYIHAGYQCAFAVITAAIISGAIVGRMKFAPYCLFVLIWTTVVYDPIAYWVWSEKGWLRVMGTLDYAGGTAVHICSASAALAAAIVLGKGHDWKPGHVRPPPNVPFTVLGAGLLWVGWIGFNSGSALAADRQAGLALVNTNGAAASALLTWCLLDSWRNQPSLVGASTGLVVGLVAVTPACGYVHPGWGLLIGVIGAVGVYLAQMGWRRYMHVDDTLDVFVCHGVGGIIGAFCTGLFADKAYNPLASDGAFYGFPKLLGYQMAGIVCTILWSGGLTAIILVAMNAVWGIRVNDEEQMLGLDRLVHKEEWMVAASAQHLALALAAKNQRVNGVEGHLDDGKLTLQYVPHQTDVKPVAVQMEIMPHNRVDEVAVSSPKEGDSYVLTSSASQV